MSGWLASGSCPLNRCEALGVVDPTGAYLPRRVVKVPTLGQRRLDRHAFRQTERAVPAPASPHPGSRHGEPVAGPETGRQIVLECEPTALSWRCREVKN
jgi:hypothetical protein